MGKIQKRLSELSIQLPNLSIPAANYIPYRIVGDMVYISGQIPKIDGTIHFLGKVGVDVNIEDARQSARLCAFNILAQLSSACDGDLDRVMCCVKLGGFVQSLPEFTQHPEVINGASDLMVEVFGDAGRHTRFAVGAVSLPRNTSVEIDALFQIRL